MIDAASENNSRARSFLRKQILEDSRRRRRRRLPRLTIIIAAHLPHTHIHFFFSFFISSSSSSSDQFSRVVCVYYKYSNAADRTAATAAALNSYQPDSSRKTE